MPALLGLGGMEAVSKALLMSRGDSSLTGGMSPDGMGVISSAAWRLL